MTDRSAFWRHILKRTKAQSVLDIGCGRGDNLLALRAVDSELAMSGIDVNVPALAQAQEAGLDVEPGSLADLPDLLQEPIVDGAVRSRHDGRDLADLVVMQATFRHYAADTLPGVMRALERASTRWVIVIDDEASPIAQHLDAMRLVEGGPAIGLGANEHFWLLERVRGSEPRQWS